MNKAEIYLSERMNFMSNERAMLLTKIDEADLEIKEIEYKITDLKNSIDDAFEIFSPRTRKNDFIKNEIKSLENEIDNLTALKDKYNKKIQEISDDIEIIRDILEDTAKENDMDIISDDMTDDDEDFKDNHNIVSQVSYLSNEHKGDNNLPGNDNMEINIREEERIFIAGRIDEKTLQPISNLIHKCEICGKVLEVDTGRAKLEIEVMYKTLSELYDNIKLFTDDLRKSIQNKDSGMSVKNISVKKLSKDNLSKGN